MSITCLISYRYLPNLLFSGRTRKPHSSTILVSGSLRRSLYLDLTTLFTSLGIPRTPSISEREPKKSMNKVNGINNARIYNSTDSYIVYSERNGQLCLGNGFIDMNIIMRFDIDVSCCCIASDGSFLVTASQAVVSIYSLTERNQDVVAENLVEYFVLVFSI